MYVVQQIKKKRIVSEADETQKFLLENFPLLASYSLKRSMRMLGRRVFKFNRFLTVQDGSNTADRQEINKFR